MAIPCSRASLRFAVEGKSAVVFARVAGQTLPIHTWTRFYGSGYGMFINFVAKIEVKPQCLGQSDAHQSVCM